MDTGRSRSVSLLERTPRRRDPRVSTLTDELLLLLLELETIKTESGMSHDSQILLA